MVNLEGDKTVVALLSTLVHNCCLFQKLVCTPTVRVCLGSGPGVCFRGPVGLLIIVALWAVGGCGCLGVPAWVSPFGGGPCHIHSLV